MSEAGPRLLDLIKKEPERNADVYVEGKGERRTLLAERGYDHPTRSKDYHPVSVLWP